MIGISSQCLHWPQVYFAFKKRLFPWARQIPINFIYPFNFSRIILHVYLPCHQLLKKTFRFLSHGFPGNPPSFFTLDFWWLTDWSFHEPNPTNKPPHAWDYVKWAPFLVGVQGMIPRLPITKGVSATATFFVESLEAILHTELPYHSGSAPSCTVCTTTCAICSVGGLQKSAAQRGAESRIPKVNFILGRAYEVLPGTWTNHFNLVSIIFYQHQMWEVLSLPSSRLSKGSAFVAIGQNYGTNGPTKSIEIRHF